MFALVLSLACAQAPAIQALDTLERSLLPSPRVATLLGATDAALRDAGWTDSETRRLREVSAASLTTSLVGGVLVGTILGAGVVLTDLQPRPGALWAGAASSVLGLGTMLLVMLISRGPTLDLVGLLAERTSRLRKEAISTSESDPAVAEATSRVAGVGVAEGKGVYLEGDTALTDEAFAERLASKPELSTLLAESKRDVIVGSLLLGTGVVSLSASPLVIGATDFSTLGNLAVVLVSAVVGLVLAAVALPVVAAAEEKEALVLDRLNAAALAEARAKLTVSPSPSSDVTEPGTGPAPAP